MRLRLRVERNGLPTVNVLWPVEDTKQTVAQFLEQVNERVPLESAHWGLEDYAVAVGGYEALHYNEIRSVFKEEDEVIIQPLQFVDHRARTLAGRDQIARDGRHLLDGVPFGKPALKRIRRPLLSIPPPAKRSKLEHVQPSDLAAASDGALVPFADLDEDSEEEDEDFELVEGTDCDNIPSSTEEVSTSGGSSLGESPSVISSSEESSSEESSSGESSSGESSSEESSSGESSSEDSSSEDSDAASASASPSSGGKSNIPPTRKLSPDRTFDDDYWGGFDVREGANSEQEQITSSRGQASQQNGSTASSQVRPGEASAVTRARNQRRKDTNKLKAAQKAGLVPYTTTLTQWKKMGVTPSPRDVLREDSKRDKPNDTHADVFPAHDKRTKKQTSLQSQHEDSDEAPEVRPIAKSTIIKAPLDPAATTQRRFRLNIASTNRMVFGSLGVRVPKTDAEKDAVKKKLAERPKRRLPPQVETHAEAQVEKAVRAAQSPQAAPRTELLIEKDIGTRQQPQVEIQVEVPIEKDTVALQPAQVEVQDETTVATDVSADPSLLFEANLNISAVEVCDENVILSKPPYPFDQFWDPQYGKTGKRGHPDPNPPTSRKKRKTKRSPEKYMASGDDSWPYDEFGEAEADNENNDNVQEGYEKYTASGDDGWSYDEFGEAEVDNENHGNVQAAYEGEGGDRAQDDNDGFPVLPADISNLPVLVESDAHVGDFITFAELTCSATTGWAPKMLNRTALLQAKGDDDGTWTIKLNSRDLRSRDYDEDGNRIYGKFEMAGMSDDGEDEDVRTVIWAGLGVAKLVQHPVAA